VVATAPIFSFLGMENEEPPTITPSFFIPSPSRAPPSV
jgi:hypothetical protein